MGWEFFEVGGPGMYPILLLGFAAVATAGLFAIRPEPRRLGLIASFAFATVGAGALALCVGLLKTLKYLDRVPVGDQMKIAALGFAESLNGLILALIMVLVAALLAAVGSFRRTPTQRV